MTRTTIISAIYGGYDSLKPACPQDGDPVDWIIVTDDPTIDGAALGWRTILDPQPDLHPNLAAKRPKATPWEYTDTEASIWIDASYRVTSPTFAADVLALSHPIAQFVHPARDCIYTETAICLDLAKYAGQPLAAQAAAYRRAGHPPHWGLWASGVIGRIHTPDVTQFGRCWLDHCHRWSFKDQLSQPHVLRLAGLRPNPLPGDHLTNPWLSYEASARHA